MVILIIGLAMGGAVVDPAGSGGDPFPQLGPAQAGQRAVSNYFDRSITTGACFKLVLDLDGRNRYTAERSDEQGLPRSAARSSRPAKGKALDSEAVLEKKNEEEEKKSKPGTRFRVDNTVDRHALEPPPKPRRAKFQVFRGHGPYPQVKLKRTAASSTSTPTRQPRAVHNRQELTSTSFPVGIPSVRSSG